jgi:hypothetical protein
MPDPAAPGAISTLKPPIVTLPSSGILDSPLDTLGAVNALIAAPWPNYIASPIGASTAAAATKLEGQPLASAHGNIGSSGWNFSLVAKNVKTNFDVTNPPGFTSAPLLQPGTTAPAALRPLPPGVITGIPGLQLATISLAAPLTGAWNLSVSGQLAVTAEVKVAGESTFSGETPSVDWGFGVRGLHLQANVDVDASTPAWPKFVQATMQPQLTLFATGAIAFSLDLGADFTVAPGKITVSKQITDLGVAIDSRLGATLTATLTAIFEAIPTTSLDAHGQPIACVPIMRTTVTLQGSLGFKFPDPIPRQNTDFTLSYVGLVPLPDMLHRFLSITGLKGEGLPREIGKQADGSIPPGGQTPAPVAGVDYDGTATVIDQGLQAIHLPYGAVLAIERLSSKADPKEPSKAPEEFYSDEEDSAVWTGHLLAAASYRYAATGTPQSLALVKTVMGGIDRLCKVAGDAVVKGTTTSAVGASVKTFARSALPADSTILWWQADQSIKNGRGYFEEADGGWNVKTKDGIRNFATYAEAEANKIPDPLPGVSLLPSTIEPVGEVWRGLGSGGTGLGGDCTTDHPVSRDQYIGIFYGLYAAYQFVATADVQAWAAGHITALLGYLLPSWNLPLPPSNAVCTSYLGAFDHQLALLRIGASVNPQAFQATYQHYAAASAVTWLCVWVTALDPLDEGYYKFNLSHAAISPLLLAEGDAGLRQNYRQAYDILRYATAHHRNAYFNLVRILVELPADRQAAMAIASGSNPGLPLSAEIQSTLAEYVRRLGLVKARNGLPTDHFPDPAFQLGLWPTQAQPYTWLFGGNQSYIAPFALAVDQRIGNIMEFLWQNDSFTLMFDPSSNPPLPATGVTLQSAQVQKDIANNSEPTRECSGADYLLPYWLAVYLGVLPKPA